MKTVKNSLLRGLFVGMTVVDMVTGMLTIGMVSCQQIVYNGI